MRVDRDDFETSRRNAVERLRAERLAHGPWEGELASSALAAATAVAALTVRAQARRADEDREAIEAGRHWLCAHQNADGGWGDTVQSASNIATTVLAWSALGLERSDKAPAETTQREATACTAAEDWLRAEAGGLGAPALGRAILRRYGADRTFSVPILSMVALCGRLGDPSQRATWHHVAQLPFELAACPRSWFNRLNLRVVSYALPALIAIGRLRHHRAPTRHPVPRILRALAERRVMRVLEAIQPSGGGFLEATPLTAFVTMALAGSGEAEHPVAQRGAAFMRGAMRADGGWPIDTNLATWLTTLSVDALAGAGRLRAHLGREEIESIRGWLRARQHRVTHPYTGAAPGGWAWTDRPGGVPDADDTAGAIVALSHLEQSGGSGGTHEGTARAAADGRRWLRGLQNKDGGIPTFCRGWGKLPFDRSTVDLSAHALRARAAWPDLAGGPDASALLDFLAREQRADGSWEALWFGNEHSARGGNATYGTARVILGLAEGGEEKTEMARRGAEWLLANQNADGGWGGERGTPSSVEETALAVQALAAAPWAARMKAGRLRGAIEAGVAWLIARTDRGRVFEASPIGFYFANLWYFERLYPLIFAVGAFERSRAWLFED